MTLLDQLTEAARKATVGPWAHRPKEHDDWGVIRMEGRDELGFQRHVAKVCYVASPEELTEHRQNGTDPAEHDAALIVILRNNLNEIVAKLRRMEELDAGLRELFEVVCGETGFAQAVRADSGRAYPWPALDIAETKARALMEKTNG